MKTTVARFCFLLLLAAFVEGCAGPISEKIEVSSRPQVSTEESKGEALRLAKEHATAIKNALEACVWHKRLALHEEFGKRYFEQAIEAGLIDDIRGGCGVALWASNIEQEAVHQLILSEATYRCAEEVDFPSPRIKEIGAYELVNLLPGYLSESFVMQARHSIWRYPVLANLADCGENLRDKCLRDSEWGLRPDRNCIEKCEQELVTRYCDYSRRKGEQKLYRDGASCADRIRSDVTCHSSCRQEKLEETKSKRALSCAVKYAPFQLPILTWKWKYKEDLTDKTYKRITAFGQIAPKSARKLNDWYHQVADHTKGTLSFSAGMYGTEQFSETVSLSNKSPDSNHGEFDQLKLRKIRDGHYTLAERSSYDNQGAKSKRSSEHRIEFLKGTWADYLNGDRVSLSFTPAAYNERQAQEDKELGRLFDAIIKGRLDQKFDINELEDMSCVSEINNLRGSNSWRLQIDMSEARILNLQEPASSGQTNCYANPQKMAPGAPSAESKGDSNASSEDAKLQLEEIFNIFVTKRDYVGMVTALVRRGCDKTIVNKPDYSGFADDVEPREVDSVVNCEVFHQGENVVPQNLSFDRTVGVYFSAGKFVESIRLLSNGGWDTMEIPQAILNDAELLGCEDLPDGTGIGRVYKIQRDKSDSVFVIYNKSCGSGGCSSEIYMSHEPDGVRALLLGANWIRAGERFRTKDDTCEMRD